MTIAELRKMVDGWESDGMEIVEMSGAAPHPERMTVLLLLSRRKTEVAT